MKYRLLGRTGLRVSELCLGTMTFGEAWGWGASEAVCERQLGLFMDAGGNFIDTSCNYTDGQSETILGKLSEPIRDKLLLATKYTLTSDKADPNAGGNHRRNLVQSLERSLKRLRTDRIDLLWLHMWDSTTAIEECLRALDDQVRLGKVLHVGISDTPAWVVSRANAIADLRGWTPFAAYQIPYSLASRSAERDCLPMAKSLGLPVIPWGVLEGGELTGKYNTPTDQPKRYAGASETAKRLSGVLAEIAADRGATASQVAINWVRQSSEATMIPLIAGRTAEQLADNLGCLAFELASEEMRKLDEASKISLGFPRSFLEAADVRELIFGDTFGQIVGLR